MWLYPAYKQFENQEFSNPFLQFIFIFANAVCGIN